MQWHLLDFSAHTESCRASPSLPQQPFPASLLGRLTFSIREHISSHVAQHTFGPLGALDGAVPPQASLPTVSVGGLTGLHHSFPVRANTCPFHAPADCLPHNWRQSGALDVEPGVFIPGGLGLRL